VPSGPALSDMVLVRKMDAYNEDADPLEPMHYEGGKVIRQSFRNGAA
jgi:hypothetical protein